MKIGYAICGSFCNLDNSLGALSELVKCGHDVTVILSEICQSTDSRFMTKESLLERVVATTGKSPMTTICETERIGPLAMFDLLVVAPCTSNTLARLCAGITDGAVTMAVKSHLRNSRPVLLAIATNDGLAASGRNIGAMLNRRNYYFVPFGQDDPVGKPRSLVAHFELLPAAAEQAIRGIQIQPMLV